MLKKVINEDERLPKLPVKFSRELKGKIEDIKFRNQQEDGFQAWTEFINFVVSYLSNRVIAWDYMSRFRSLSNGTIYANIFGCEVGYMIKTYKGKNYVYIFQMNLKRKIMG